MWVMFSYIPSPLKSGGYILDVSIDISISYSFLEDGGTMFTFEGTKKKSPLKVYVKVHNPQFYLKVITQFY